MTLLKVVQDSIDDGARAKVIVERIMAYLQQNYDSRAKNESWFCKGDMRLTTIECLKELLIAEERGYNTKENTSEYPNTRMQT